MLITWLFGPHAFSESALVLQSRVLDVDTVVDVYRILEAAFNDTNETNEAHRPQVVLQPAATSHLQHLPTKSVSIGEVPGLGARERSEIMVNGMGLQVDFRRRTEPGVIINGANRELALQVAHLIEHSGPRRIWWNNLRRCLPTLMALTLSVSGLWTLLTSRPALPAWIFVGALFVSTWVAAGFVTRRLTRDGAFRPGHRFREVSRSSFRERQMNTRVALLNGTIGAVLGAAVTYLLGVSLR